jgi:hypothetical protein
MDKIPLEKIIGAAYRFFFSNILSILGTVWFPLLLMGALIAASLWAVLPASFFHGDFEHFDKQEFLAVVPALIAVYPVVIFASLVLSAMIAVGITRRALGMTHGPTFIYFSLGAPVWRMVGAFILFFLGYIMFVGLTVGVCVAVVFASTKLDSKVLAGLIDAAVIIGAGCFMIYAIVRVYFFLPAVVVAEEHISFSRSWRLGRGNFWRIVLLALMIIIPVSFVGGMISQIFIMGSMGSNIQVLPENPSPEQTAHFFKMLFTTMMPALAISYVLQQLAIAGLWYGAVGLAYRALVPASPPAQAQG